MSPAEREESIVQGAISFFADVGFDGQTRELASRLGITQPLIFRYFPTKDDLIERIYQRLYVGRWNPEWRKMIGDRETPLAARLTRMYRIYVTEVLTSEWVRIFLFSGLKGSLFNKRYIDLIGKLDCRGLAGLDAVDGVGINIDVVDGGGTPRATHDDAVAPAEGA